MINNASDERLTVGQLKEVLDNFDDSIEVVVPFMRPDRTINDYEQTGILFEVVSIDTGYMDGQEFIALGVTPIQLFPETLPGPSPEPSPDNGLAA